MTADVSMDQQIKEVLATYLKRDPKTILPEHNLRDDLGLDSLMTFELLYDLEKTFDLEIPNEDLPGLQTIADVVKYLEARISPEALRNIRTPSPPTQPTALPDSSVKPSSPVTRGKPPQGGKVKKVSTPKVKAEAKPASKAKPRASQKVALSKRKTATTNSTRTTQEKAKKK